MPSCCSAVSELSSHRHLGGLMSSTAITLSFSQRSRDNRRSRTVRLPIIVDDEEDESIQSRVPDIFEVKESAPNLFEMQEFTNESCGPASMVGIGPKSNSDGCGMSYVLMRKALFFHSHTSSIRVRAHSKANKLY